MPYIPGGHSSVRYTGETAADVAEGILKDAHMRYLLGIGAEFDFDKVEMSPAKTYPQAWKGYERKLIVCWAPHPTVPQKRQGIQPSARKTTIVLERSRQNAKRWLCLDNERQKADSKGGAIMNAIAMTGPIVAACSAALAAGFLPMVSCNESGEKYISFSLATKTLNIHVVYDMQSSTCVRFKGISPEWGDLTFYDQPDIKPFLDMIIQLRG
jgi:hypothetical protein